MTRGRCLATLQVRLKKKSKAQERGEREALLRHGDSMTMESSCTLYHALSVDTDASPHFPVGRVMY